MRTGTGGELLTPHVELNEDLRSLYNEKWPVYNDGTAHAELSKTNRFPLLNGTVNAFLIQNGKRSVL